MKTTVLYFFAVLLMAFFSCSKTEVETIPLPEHPLPNFQRTNWQNLNGYWQFKPDSVNVGIKENWQNQAEFFDQKILVPFSWASPASEIALPNVHVGWYYRTFTITNRQIWKNKDTYLKFCASDFETTLWVNGKKVGSHKGGYTPFDFNITHFLVEGENKLVVRVEDEELRNRPSGKQYYGNAKGIWQTVYLEGRSQKHISLILFTPNIDENSVAVKVTLSEPLKENATFSLKGSSIDFSGEIEAGAQQAGFTVPIVNMKLWDVVNPYLYEVNAAVTGENINDEVSTYFGMRKISSVDIPGKDFQYVALNNKPVYLKLALDQSYHPEGFYTFPSDEFMKEEIQRAKNLGLNGLRIHIKAEVPRKLYWADKLGLLIQEDVPNFWGEPDSTAKANWEQVAASEIARDYNCPSIFSWCLFNETWGLFSRDSVSGKREYLPETQEWVRNWYHKTKQYDPTRLVEDNSPCNWDHVITDINTWHRYSPARHWAGFLDMVVDSTFPGSSFNYIGNNVQTNVPMFNSECGAVWGYNGSTGDIDITWEYHIMMNEFRKRPKIAGFLFTEFHDVINEWNGYYRFDRSNKEFGLDELYEGMTIRDFHTDLYVVSGEDFFREFTGGSVAKIPVGISAVTHQIPKNLKIQYSVYGWNSLAEKVSISAGEVPGGASPFSFTEIEPVEIELPNLNLTAIFATTLLDENGKVLQKNFVPFKVKGINPENIVTITKSPEEFSSASWSIKHHLAQKNKKLWGMGSGFFEYEFELPENINTEKIEGIEFRAELASRYPQEKYLEDGDAERIGMTVVSTKGIIPGYGKNSYPQTDENLHGSMLTITANDQIISEVELPDDPADHRGILSWVNQEPGWEWGSNDHSKPWLLDEAGSYGYLVKAELGENAKNSALQTGKVTIRLHVDESSGNRGGLSVYGAESGMYPMDITLLVRYN